MPTTTEKLTELNDLAVALTRNMANVAGSVAKINQQAIMLGATLNTLKASIADVEKQMAKIELPQGPIDYQGGQPRIPPQPDKVVRVELGNASIDAPAGQAEAFIEELQRVSTRTPR